MHFRTIVKLIGCLALIASVGVIFWIRQGSLQSQYADLYFQLHDGGIGTERRYIPSIYGKEYAILLIDELLLGPADHRFLRFTDPSVRPRNCFVRGRALYVDFSEHILKPRAKTPDWQKVFALLRENIRRNCKNIDSIYFYIEGMPSYIGNR